VTAKGATPASTQHAMLGKALDILELLAHEPAGLSLAAICRRTGIPKTNVLRLVHTLARREYLRCGTDDHYRIGIRLFEIGNTYLATTEVTTELQRIVTEVSLATQETVHLGILDGTDVVYMMKHESTQPVRMASSIGRRMPAHATALGKALLSGLDRDELARRFSKSSLAAVTSHTLRTRAGLFEQLEEIAQTGLAYEREESSVGVGCVAVAIRDANGAVILALSISVPLYRLDETRRVELSDVAIDARKQLERIIHSHGPEPVVP
jgi:IclR family transcriptional regulator, KDG regulon repressor